MDTLFSRNNSRNRVREPAPVSLCIVTHQLNKKLEEIINATHESVYEILIGYDSGRDTLPAHFDTQGKATIIPLTWQGYSDTKNVLAAKAKTNWILSLDGDEVPDHQLLRQIRELNYATLTPNHIGLLKRISFFEQQKIKHGAWGKDRIMRLYHKGYTGWDDAVVHEDIRKKEDTVLLPLKGILYHYTAENYASFLVKNKKYALLSADKYFSRGKKSPLWKRMLSPAFTFMKEYILLGGFLDGAAGWKIARADAVYTYWKYYYLYRKYRNQA